MGAIEKWRPRGKCCAYKRLCCGIGAARARVNRRIRPRGEVAVVIPHEACGLDRVTNSAYKRREEAEAS